MNAMYYAVVYFPRLDDERITVFRHDYDPFFELIDEHLTLVFPIPDEINLATIIKRIREVFSRWDPFEIRFGGLEKSWDYWLFLLVNEGNDQIVQLHDDLYDGVLKPFLRAELQYVPHIALGLFANEDYDPLNPTSVDYNQVRFKEAFTRAQELDLDYRRTIDALTLIGVNSSLSNIQKLKEFSLY